jgi:hypothetical protein
LFAFYEKKLKAEFAKERETEVYNRYQGLKQGNKKPGDFFSELSSLHRELGQRVGEYELSERFENGLHEKVKTHVMNTLITMTRQARHARLHQTVQDADSIWANLPETDRAVSKEKSPSPKKEAAAPKEKMKYCEYHGSQSSHTTSECKILAGKRGKSALVTEGAPSWAQQLVALLTQQQSQGGAQKPRKSGADSGGGNSGPSGGKAGPSGGGGGRSGSGQSRQGGRSGREYDEGPPCDFCGRRGHSDDRCFIKHPDRAPPNYKPASKGLQILFDTMKAQKGGKVAACVVEDDFGEEDEDLRTACVTHGFSLWYGEDVDLGSKDPAEVARLTSDAVRQALQRVTQKEALAASPATEPKKDAVVQKEELKYCMKHGYQATHDTVHCKALAAAARQLVPASFEPKPLDIAAYPPPPAKQRVEGGKGNVAKEDLDCAAVRRVAEMSFGSFCRTLLALPALSRPNAYPSPIEEVGTAEPSPPASSAQVVQGTFVAAASDAVQTIGSWIGAGTSLSEAVLASSSAASGGASGTLVGARAAAHGPMLTSSAAAAGSPSAGTPAGAGGSVSRALPPPAVAASNGAHTSLGAAAGASGVLAALAARTGSRCDPEGYLINVPVTVRGCPGDPPRTVAQLSPRERERALVANPDAAKYLAEPTGMYYYPKGACTIDVGGRVLALSALRDQAATVSLIPHALAVAHDLPIRPTGTKLSTSMELGCAVMGELNVGGLWFELVRGTPYATRIPLTQTLVVDVKPSLFQFLVGNEQAKLLGDGIRSYPTPQLFFHPNLIEHPDYQVTIPMQPFPYHLRKGNRTALVTACVSSASASSSPSGLELGGGALRAEPFASQPTQPTQDKVPAPLATAPTTKVSSGPDKVGSTEPPEAPPKSAGAPYEASNPKVDSRDAPVAEPALKRNMLGGLKGVGGSIKGFLLFLLTSIISGITTVSGVLAKHVASPVLAAMDRVVEHACVASAATSTGRGEAQRAQRVRKGKRKRTRPSPASPPCPLPPRRSWSHLLSFALVASLLFTLAAGVGAVHGGVMDSDLARISSNVVTTRGVLLRQAGGQIIFSSRPEFDPCADPGWHEAAHAGGHATAMASVGSFTPEGVSSAAAYDRYEKDPEGGWIWGNGELFDTQSKAALQEVVRSRKGKAFAYSMEELPGYHGAQGPFTLDLETDRPVVQPPRRYSPKEKEVIKEKTDELVKAGIVVEHSGPTACVVNPVIAAKKDPETGMWTDHRMAQDYRPVNKLTRADRYGMHRPEDIFHQCSKARVFSKLDLRQGFLQIPIAPSDQPKTAYWVGNKHMMYTRMPYGLKNASAKFQRVMDYELAMAGLDHCSRAYVDDVLIFSNSVEEHIEHVAAVLDALHSCGLRAHPDKSIFGADVLEYLGHNLSSSGISPHHAKVAAIMCLKAPGNVSELRAHLGFITYYRCYIPNMSQLTAPLTQLLKKDQVWVWGPEQEAAFASIKAVFAKEGLVLRPIDYSKPLILHTDFSNRGIGAVLGQYDSDGNEYMCACISRSLNKHERNYSSYKGEMLAAVWGCKSFRHHLLGGPKFTLVTDHQPLTYLMGTDGLTGQYARFAAVMQEYDFEVVHRPGLKHQNADVLSRYPSTSDADPTGARLDEEEMPPLVPTEALFTHARMESLALRTALASHTPVASFSDDFCFAPDVFMPGNLGLPSDPMSVPPDSEHDVVSTARDRVYASAVQWVRDASKTNPGIFQYNTDSYSRPFFARGLGTGITVYEPIGGMCAGLEACLRAGLKVDRYLCSDPDPVAVRVVNSRVEKLCAEFPKQLSLDAVRRVWLDLPQSLPNVTEQALLAAGACDGSQWFVFASWCWHDVGKESGSLAPGTCATDHVVRIVQTLQSIQRRAPAYMFVCEQPRASWQNARAAQQRVASAFGEPVVVDSARFGSMAHRLSAHWTNLAPHEHLSLATSFVRPSHNMTLQSVLSSGRTIKPARAADTPGLFPCNTVGEPLRVAPSLSRPELQSLFDLVHDPLDPDNGALTITESECAMGYLADATDAPGVNETQRRIVLGLSPDAMSTAGMLSICRALSDVSLHDVAALVSDVTTHTPTEPVHGLAYPLFPSEFPSSWAVAFAAAAHAEQDESARSAARWPDVWEDEATMHLLRNGTHLPNSSDAEQRRAGRRAGSYSMQGGALYRVFNDSKSRLVPKPPDRLDLIRRTHEEIWHFGIRRTSALLLTQHWWYGMYRDVENFVRHCEHCDRVNTSFATPQPDLHPLPVQGLFYRWGVDLCGPLPATKTGNVYVMICVEHFSKYTVLVPLPDKEAGTTSFAYLHHVLGRFGASAEVCTDGGTEWKGPFAQLLLDSLIDHRQTSPNHPQANGLAERVVQTCKRALRRMARQRAEGRNWDELLPYVMLGYNCSTHKSTGFSPYLILHGVEPTIPPAIKPRFDAPVSFDGEELAAASILARADAMRQRMAIAGENLLIAQHRDTLRYAALRGGGYHPKLREFDVGDYVYYRNTSSRTTLDPPAQPTILRVIEVRPSGILVLEGHCGQTLKSHVKDCAPCHLPIRDEVVDPRVARPSATLSCQTCRSPKGEEWMLLCDSCGTGWHTYCLRPALKQIPEGTWVCPNCTSKGITPEHIDARPIKGSREPGATNVPHPDVVPKPRPPQYTAELQGARVVRQDHGAKGAAAAKSGVATYVGRQGRRHCFEVLYDDGELELVDPTRLRTMLAPKAARPRRTGRPAALVATTQPETWSLGAGGDVGSALGAAMPGEHPYSKVALLSRVVNAGEFDRPTVPREHVEALVQNVELGLVRDALFPWGVDPSIRAVLMSKGVRVMKGKPSDAREPLSPGFYEAAQKELKSVESVFLSVTGAPLDLAIPAAMKVAQGFVVARVPMSYVSGADEVRMRWLKSLQKQGRLLMFRCPFEGSQEVFMWLVVFASAAVRRLVVKQSGFVEDIA